MKFTVNGKMDYRFLIIILVSSAIMMSNIIRYYNFIRSSNDVITSGSGTLWKYASLGMLIFFLFGYLFIGFFSKPDIMIAMILFFGSIFVMLTLTLIFTLLGSIKERGLKIVEVLIGIIDARDPNLDGHSQSVKNVTMLFYRYLPEEIKDQINPVSLEYAALMHDIGKLGIPESILNKPGKLDEEEWKVMRSHPEMGVKILEPLHIFDEIADWIRYHHERQDGKGYYSLPYEKIPLAARILAIADTYSAITMRRSYKEPRSHEDAIEIIKDVAGTQLDKDLVEVFLKIPKEELTACIPENVKY